MSKKSSLNLDKDSKKLLKKIYKDFETKEDLSATSSEYEKIQDRYAN